MKKWRARVDDGQPSYMGALVKFQLGGSIRSSLVWIIAWEL